MTHVELVNHSKSTVIFNPFFVYFIKVVRSALQHDNFLFCGKIERFEVTSADLSRRVTPRSPFKRNTSGGGC